MTTNFSNASHTLDSLAGVIAAFEGIREAHSLLIGPMACNSYLTYITNLQDPIVSGCLSNLHFGRRRISCTFVNQQDFIYGTEEKLLKSLKMLEEKSYKLLGIINHPGTSLIGDDLNRIVRESQITAKTTIIDSTGFTGTVADGFKTAVTKILKTVIKDSLKKIPKSVNIIGPSILHYNWANDIAELKRTLQILGIKVISVICADETLANLEYAPQAELNLVTHEEYGDSTATFLEKEFGIPHTDLGLLAPFGLAGSELWFKSVADYFNLPHEEIELESKRVRMRCYPTLARIAPLSKGLKGSSFGIFGDSSVVSSLIVFLHQYLGMYPEIVGLNEVGTNSFNTIKEYLKNNYIDASVLIKPDQFEIMDCLNKRTPDFLFGSSVEKYVSKFLGSKQPHFIPISFPFHEKALITIRPLIGFNGVLTLVENIINASNYLLKRGK